MNKTHTLVAAALAVATLSMLLPAVAAEPITLVYRCPEPSPGDMVKSCVWIGLNETRVPIYEAGTVPSEKCIDSENCVRHSTPQLKNTDQQLIAYWPNSYGYVELTQCPNTDLVGWAIESDAVRTCRVTWSTGPASPDTEALVDDSARGFNQLLA